MGHLALFKPDVVTVGETDPSTHALTPTHTHHRWLSHQNEPENKRKRKSVGRTTQGIITATTNNNVCEASV